MLENVAQCLTLGWILSNDIHKKNGYEIWNLEYRESLYSQFVETATGTWLRISYYLVGQQNIRSAKDVMKIISQGEDFWCVFMVKGVEFLSECM